MDPRLPCVLGAWFSAGGASSPPPLPSAPLVPRTGSSPWLGLLTQFLPLRSKQGCSGRHWDPAFFIPGSPLLNLEAGGTVPAGAGGELVCPQHRPWDGAAADERVKLPPPPAAWAAQCSPSGGTEGGGFLLPHQHFLAGSSRSERAGRALPGASSQDAEEPCRQKAAALQGGESVAGQFFLWPRERGGSRARLLGWGSPWPRPGLLRAPRSCFAPPLLRAPFSL